MRPASYHTYTQEELDYIRMHCGDNARSVHEVIGGNYFTIREYMRKFRNGTFQRSSGTPQKYYALYLRKTDELVCSGSAKECMAELGISKSAFHTLVCKSRSGKIKKWDVYVEPYNEED